MLKIIPLLFVSLLGTTFAITPVTTTLQPSTLYMSKIGTQATPLGNGCFYPILVRLNVTWTGTTSFYTVQIPNFWLVITARNTIVGNSTNAIYENPSNTIGQFNVFPNIPVALTLSFSRTCLANVNVAQLVYLDGTYNFTFILP